MAKITTSSTAAESAPDEPEVEYLLTIRLQKVAPRKRRPEMSPSDVAGPGVNLVVNGLAQLPRGARVHLHYNVLGRRSGRRP